MVELEYPCHCKIDFGDNHCCDAHTVDICDEHKAELEKIEEREFQWRTKYSKEHPVKAYNLAQLFLDAMDTSSEGVIVRDILPSSQ